MTDQLPQIQHDSQGNQYLEVGPYRLTLIKPLCIGASSCVAISPDVFKINEQNIAEFIANGTDDPSTLLLAAQACPTRAIIVTNRETGDQLWPRK